MEDENKDNIDAMDSFLKGYEKLMEAIGAGNQQYVPYDVFKQSMEWNGSNMRYLYDIYNKLANEKMFCVEFSIGEISYHFSGRHEDSDKIIKAAEKMTKNITTQLLDKERIELISNNIKRKKDEQEKIYS